MFAVSLQHMYIWSDHFYFKQKTNSNYLYDVDDVIGQPEYCKGTDNQQDQTSALSSEVEPCILQAADDRRVTSVDEAEGHQAAHDSLKQVLEDFVANTVPVVWHTKP